MPEAKELGPIAGSRVLGPSFIGTLANDHDLACKSFACSKKPAPLSTLASVQGIY
jgi:hypothetical protein